MAQKERSEGSMCLLLIGAIAAVVATALVARYSKSGHFPAANPAVATPAMPTRTSATATLPACCLPPDAAAVPDDFRPELSPAFAHSSAVTR
ncbi:MAG: hypothetical protein ACM3TU_03345 [Bacillota bacterium]